MLCLILTCIVSLHDLQTISWTVPFGLMVAIFSHLNHVIWIGNAVLSCVTMHYLSHDNILCVILWLFLCVLSHKVTSCNFSISFVRWSSLLAQNYIDSRSKCGAVEARQWADSRYPLQVNLTESKESYALLQDSLLCSIICIRYVNKISYSQFMKVSNRRFLLKLHLSSHAQPQQWALDMKS